MTISSSPSGKLNFCRRKEMTMKNKQLPLAARYLPIEQSAKFEFVINLRAAKQIGLTMRQHFERLGR